MDSPFDDLSAEKSLSSSLSSEYEDTFISDNHFMDEFTLLNDDFLSFEDGGQQRGGVGGSTDTSHSSSPSEAANTLNQDTHDYDDEALLDFTQSFVSTYESLLTPSYEDLEAEQNSQIGHLAGSATTSDDKPKRDQPDNEGDNTLADDYLDLDFEFDEFFEPSANSISSSSSIDTNSDTNSENMTNSAVQPQSSPVVSSPAKSNLKVIVIRSSEVSVKSGGGVNKKKKSSTVKAGLNNLQSSSPSSSSLNTLIKLYTCAAVDCHFRTTSLPSMTTHKREKHSTVTPFKCNVCGFLTDVPSTILVHLSKHNSFTCNYSGGCSFVGLRKNDINQHKLAKHPPGSFTFQCPVLNDCSIDLPTVERLQEHTAAHVIPFYCRYPGCKYASSSANHVQKHAAGKHLKNREDSQPSISRSFVGRLDPKCPQKSMFVAVKP